jgi:hypothetical protein
MSRLTGGVRKCPRSCTRPPMGQVGQNRQSANRPFSIHLGRSASAPNWHGQCITETQDRPRNPPAVHAVTDPEVEAAKGVST